MASTFWWVDTEHSVYGEKQMEFFWSLNEWMKTLQFQSESLANFPWQFFNKYKRKRKKFLQHKCCDTQVFPFHWWCPEPISLEREREREHALEALCSVTISQSSIPPAASCDWLWLSWQPANSPRRLARPHGFGTHPIIASLQKEESSVPSHEDAASFKMWCVRTPDSGAICISGQREAEISKYSAGFCHSSYVQRSKHNSHISWRVSTALNRWFGF